MTNTLEHLADFQKILKDYHISQAGKKLLAKMKLVLLVGPSSAGRNTIINALVETNAYRYLVSDTTRKPRVNNGILEQNGVEYWFRNEAEILDDLKNGEFLEAAIIHNQQVSGISLRELNQSLREEKIAVTEIETVGMRKIHELKPDSFAFFVAPPTFEVWMKRMDGRGKMPEVEKRRRMESAAQEFEAALTHDYYTFIINDEFEHSVERIHGYVIEGLHDLEYQEHGRTVIEKLLVDTQAYLAAI